MEELRIEKGVPIKAFYEAGNTELLKKMEVGDSVFISNNSTTQQTRNRFYSIAKRIGIKVIIRKVEGGARMWRIE